MKYSHNSIFIYYSHYFPPNTLNSHFAILPLPILMRDHLNGFFRAPTNTALNGSVINHPTPLRVKHYKLFCTDLQNG